MAEIIQEEKAGGKKKAKKHAPHIDMTPMVDLMCLLITFLCSQQPSVRLKLWRLTFRENQG